MGEDGLLIPVSSRMECSICFAELHRTDGSTLLPCSHRFHKSCLASWLQRQPTCPLCRAQVPGAQSGVSRAETGSLHHLRAVFVLDPGFGPTRPRWIAARDLIEQLRHTNPASTGSPEEPWECRGCGLMNFPDAALADDVVQNGRAPVVRLAASGVALALVGWILVAAHRFREDVDAMGLLGALIAMSMVQEDLPTVSARRFVLHPCLLSAPSYPPLRCHLGDVDSGRTLVNFVRCIMVV
eukprot:CAMPEP_0204478156 /NCGR_PEP_ID=MMETSP0471-20130131/33364_1 /ASSEMBLY_ACC=CAM_ASM_000602 /TAXON_ID=2969 /ORGANISM="Oxyrrhis marina" /LENGTH=239 /DNA_ID=CAMNT_0051480963 /DNA_START=12 /DNA_END=729 /DNA_ORIENTATION=+